LEVEIEDLIFNCLTTLQHRVVLEKCVFAASETRLSEVVNGRIEHDFFVLDIQIREYQFQLAHLFSDSQ